VDDALRFWITVPFVTAAVTAIVPLLIPTFRWSRALQRDLTILRDLPEGVERNLLQEYVVFQARRIRQYRTMIHPLIKFLGWVAPAAAANFLLAAIISGGELEPGSWILFAGVIVDALYAVPATFAGVLLGGGRAGEWDENQDTAAARANAGAASEKEPR
jgi:hypothetical protein